MDVRRNHGVLTNLRVVSIPDITCINTDPDSRIRGMTDGYVRDSSEFICPVCGHYSHASSYKKLDARRVFGSCNAFHWAKFKCGYCKSEFKTGPFIVTPTWFDERPDDGPGSVLSAATLFEDSYFFGSVKEIKNLKRKVHEDPTGIAIGVVVGMILSFIVLCLLPGTSSIKTILLTTLGAGTITIFLCTKLIARTVRYLSRDRESDLSATKKAP